MAASMIFDDEDIVAEFEAALLGKDAERTEETSEPVPLKTEQPTEEDENFVKLCADGTPQQIEAAIEEGADVNSKFGRFRKAQGERMRLLEGATALTAAAAYNKNPEVISILLNAGADANAGDKNGNIPLMWAAGNNSSPEAVSMLLEAGADVNAKNKGGNTPLLFAINNSNPEVISLLLEAGAEVNVKNNDGCTPLMRALDRDNPEAVSLLQEAGAENDEG